MAANCCSFSFDPCTVRIQIQSPMIKVHMNDTMDAYPNYLEHRRLKKKPTDFAV